MLAESINKIFPILLILQQQLVIVKRANLYILFYDRTLFLKIRSLPKQQI